MIFPPFSGEDRHRSFLHRYARPLLMAIHPEDPEFIDLRDPDEAIDLMVRKNPDLDVVFGLLRTIPRQMRGLEFINISCLKSSLGARWIGKKGEAPNLKSPSASPLSTRFAVVRGEAGHLYLKGALDYKPLIEIPNAQMHTIIARLEEVLAEQAEARKNGLSDAGVMLSPTRLYVCR